MVSGTLKVIFGLLAVVVAILILLTALSYATGYCVSTSGGKEFCTTNTSAVIGVIFSVLVGIFIGGLGLRTIWKA
jgi:hypothetical protein